MFPNEEDEPAVSGENTTIETEGSNVGSIKNGEKYRVHKKENDEYVKQDYYEVEFEIESVIMVSPREYELRIRDMYYE